MFDLLIYVHIGSLCVALLGILLADASAARWLLGKCETVDRRLALIAHRVVSIALASVVVSGLSMFWPMRDYLVGQPVFWLKMSFVLVLLINAFFIEHLMQRAFTRSFRSLSMTERMPLFVSGALSTISWIGALAAALVLFD